MEHVVEVDVGDVLPAPGDAGTAADAGRRLADAHCGATFASGTADRSPTVGVGVPCSCSSPAAAQHGLDDLLVAGAAAEVAGEPLLDLGARRVRDRRRAAPCGGDQLARDAEAALRGARVEERLLERVELAAGGEALDGRDHARAVRLDREHQARVDAAPSTSTVHAPHSPTRQHSFVPVRPRSSRSTSSSVWCARTIDRPTRGR